MGKTASTGAAFPGLPCKACPGGRPVELNPFSQLSSFTLEALWGKRRRGETRNTDWGTCELALCFGVWGGPSCCSPLGAFKNLFHEEVLLQVPLQAQRAARGLCWRPWLRCVVQPTRPVWEWRRTGAACCKGRVLGHPGASETRSSTCGCCCRVSSSSCMSPPVLAPSERVSDVPCPILWGSEGGWLNQGRRRRKQTWGRVQPSCSENGLGFPLQHFTFLLQSPSLTGERRALPRAPWQGLCLQMFALPLSRTASPAARRGAVRTQTCPSKIGDAQKMA